MIDTSLRFTGALCLAVGIAAGAGGAAAGANEALEATTELGVTVTTDDILDSLEEASCFWPAVRRYVLSPQFSAADEAARIEAEAYIRQVQDRLHERLMGEDEAAGLDLLTYVRWNIRRQHFFRELRAVVKNEDQVLRLRSAWYRNFNRAADDGATIDLAALVAQIEPVVKLAALAPEDHAKVMSLWSNVGACMIRMEETQTGKLIREAELALSGLPHEQLVRRIVSAADWAGIIKTRQGPAACEDFIAAWDALNRPMPVESAAVGR
jgi:hypothetical protein